MKKTINDSESYLAKKDFFDRVLTIYGRKPVLEAVSQPDIDIYRLHLAESNKPADILRQIMFHCDKKNVEIRYHSKAELSRISKNSKQDQGVAVDIQLKNFVDFNTIFNVNPKENSQCSFIALDGITNPQNLGLIIRSVCASPTSGLILPKNGCAKIDALVIKASAGTLFKTKIIRSKNLSEDLSLAKEKGFRIVALDVKSKTAIGKLNLSGQPSIFVMGNESKGLSKEVEKVCTDFVKIPMQNGVESLNVAVAASLVAFHATLW